MNNKEGLFARKNNDAVKADLESIKRSQNALWAIVSQVLDSHQSEGLRKLKSILRDMDPRISLVFRDIFLKPLNMVIYEPEKWNEETLLDTIDCFVLMLQKNLINSFDGLFDLYAILFKIIDIETNKFLGECKITEDLKLRVINCIKLIINSFTDAIIKEFLTESTIFTLLVHSVHVLLNHGLNEKFKELKMNAIATLNCLIVKFDSIEYVKHPDPGDIFAYFLPGISIAMLKIITSDDKLPQKLLIECLNTYSSIVKIVLRKSGSIEKETVKSKKLPLFVVDRNSDWLKENCAKIDIVYEKIIKTLVVHRSHLVRSHLLKTSQKMIDTFSCIDTQQEVLLTFIQVPLVFVTDDHDELKKSSEQLLQKFADLLPTKPSLRDALFDKLYQIVTSFTRELQTVSEDQKVAKFKVLVGYFTCLGPHGLNTFLISQSCQSRLLQSLISCATLDEKRSTQGYKLIEMIDLETVHSKKLSNQYPIKRFKYFDDSECEFHLKRACNLLGQYVESFGLVDYFTNILNQGGRNPAIIFVSNNIIDGIKRTDFLGSLLDEYINQLAELTDKNSDNSSITIATCLLMEGLATLSMKYGPNQQHKVLINSFYLILANTGSNKSLISDTALITLQRMCQAFSYSSIENLVSDNIDYVLNYLNVKLKHFESNRKVCSVIYALLNLTEPGSLSYFEFTMSNILASLDIYYNMKCDILVDILNIVISFMTKEVATLNEILPKNLEYGDSETRKAKFINELTEFFESRRIVNALDAEEPEPMMTQEGDDNLIDKDFEAEMQDTNDEKKKQLPVNIKITIQILERCIHLLSNPSIDIQLTTMEIIMKGLKILKPWEDELLPLAHKLWTPISKRFKSSNPLLLKKCFHCLITMANCCGDFLRSRTLSQVMPGIVSFLRSQWSSSFCKTDSSPYKHTLEYQLQHEILSLIGLICCYLNVEGLDLWPIIEVILPYLTVKQPKSLQQAAIASCKHLMFLDPYAVTSYLNELIDAKNDSERKNYESNVRSVMSVQL